MNKEVESMIWSVAPVSRTQVSSLWAVLFEGFLAKIEFFKLRKIESRKEAQEIPERAELVEWIASMLLEEDAWELSIDNNYWHCSAVKGKDLNCDVASDWPESLSRVTWLAIDTLPFCLYSGGNPTNL